jgi:hypothetical protein
MSKQPTEAKDGVLRGMCLAYPSMGRSEHSTKLSLSCSVRALGKRISKGEKHETAIRREKIHTSLMNQLTAVQDDVTEEAASKVNSFFWNQCFLLLNTVFLQKPKKTLSENVAQFKEGKHVSMHNLSSAWYVCVFFSFH